MSDTMFNSLVGLCKNLESTTKKKEKTKLLAEFLQKLKPDEISDATLLIVGSIFPEFDPRSLDIGWKTVKTIFEGARQTTLFNEPLTIKRVRKTLTEIAERTGSGSRRIKTNLLEGLIQAASKEEAEIIVRIIFNDMRIGVSEGIMLEGISAASGIPLNVTRRALMMTGNLGKVAQIALTEGETGLKELQAIVFVPLKPMLATMGEDVGQALIEHGGKTAFEYKYDGARIQIHRKNGDVKVFSRNLSDVTESIPDITEVVLTQITGGDIILDGEVVAIGENQKPLPFQDLMRRFTRINEVKKTSEIIPLDLHIFDILYYDGTLLIDEPYEKRLQILEKYVPRDLIVNKIVTSDIHEAEKFKDDAVTQGHEGLIAKQLDSPYSPGSRGKFWIKIKPTETLDLIIVAADWCSGRRQGWLSNHHLSVWSGTEFLIIGKTFKGLTDKEFNWITKKLQEIKTEETNYTVKVKPELVVEVAFNEIQKSSHYKSGYALRFARITRIRADKTIKEADTLERVQELYEAQFQYKDKLII